MSLLKKLIRLSLLVSLWPLYAAGGNQDSITAPGKWMIGINYHWGFIIAHRPSIVHLQDDHCRSFEFSLMQASSGRSAWQSLYGFPLLGLGFQAIDLGNKKELGMGYALYPQLLFPMLKKERLRLGLRFAAGIGYIEKPFDTETNYKNTAVSSRWNAFILLGLQGRIPVSGRLQLDGGIQLEHFSNGASSKPNLGINLPTAYMGLNYFFGTPYKLANAVPAEEYRKGHEITGYLAFGVKDLTPANEARYNVVILNGLYNYKISRKTLLGAGADVFIDSSLPPQLEDDSIETSFAKGATRLGLHASVGARIGRWDGLFQTGIYLYSQFKEDGLIYNRLSFRYNFSSSMFACVNLKSHFARADYFEWGLGYRFGNENKH